MNKPLTSKRFRSHLANLAVLVLFGSTITVLTGCGGGDPEETTVVTPPTPEGEEPEQTSDEAPGALEMPTGEIPSSDDPASEQEQGGIELPTNVEIPDTSSVPPAAGAEVRYATWEAIQNEVKASGKVTVVDLWSLTCEPCLKEFPGLVDLHRSLGTEVHCVAVDMDYDGRKSRPPSYYEEKVATFLASVQASGFPTYISETPSDDIFTSMDVISIPAVLVYDDSGTLVKKFVDAGPEAGFTYHDDVTPFVQQLAKN